MKSVGLGGWGFTLPKSVHRFKLHRHQYALGNRRILQSWQAGGWLLDGLEAKIAVVGCCIPGSLATGCWLAWMLPHKGANPCPIGRLHS